MAPRVLIFGTGGVGIVYAYVLSRQLPPANVVCVCRSNYEAAKSDGFTVNSTIWGKNLQAKPTIVRTIEEASKISSDPYDYVIVSTKALSTTPSTAQIIQPVIGATTTIVLFQNGIGIEEEYSSLYPSNPLLSTVVYLPATQTSPCVVEHTVVEHLLIGTYPATAPSPHKVAAQSFSDLITSCSASAQVQDDIQLERWSKLLVNGSWNPICALTKSKDMLFIANSPISEEETLSYVRDVMLEIASIAQAYGYKEINEQKIDYQLERATSRGLPGVEPSMLADVRGRKRVEVDAIVGNALKLAREKGLNTPLLRGLYVLLSGLDGSIARTKQ